MKIELKIKEIWTLKELLKEKKKMGVGDDWHEPDNQSITAFVVGEEFDNAGCGNELNVIVQYEGRPLFAINLAILFALATGYKGVE